ncbi:MAG: aldehyde dehydrogenase family protein, partial [Ilumatobacteraceae bacterium]
PTLLSGVTASMTIYREETFGPVAPIITYGSVEEVVALANDTEYGLAAYVYTNDISTAIRTAEGLRFGIIGVNDVNPTSASVPFGGMKDSGIGREGSHDGIEEYLETKSIGFAV